jgi:hypothetical protein
MHLRRNIALALTGLVLAAPALTSCGFDYATDRVYTPAAGVNNQDTSVDVLGAVIVSGRDDSGTFIASFANNDVTQEATVESLAGAGGTTIQPGSFSPIKIPAGGLVNLATEGGIPVTGTFTAGDFIPVTVTFGSGERATLTIPVVTDDGNYAGLDTSSSGAGPSESESASPTE